MDVVGEEDWVVKKKKCDGIESIKVGEDWKEWRKQKKLQHKKWKEEKLLKKHAKLKRLEEEKIAENINENAASDENGRMYTVSIALPGSILDNAQSVSLRTYLVGQIARAASIFHVDEIIVFNEQKSSKVEDDDTFSGVKKQGQSCTVMGHILQYLECPQYLRKYFFPLHPDLTYAGLLNPLDSPHHFRGDEESVFRDGCTINRQLKTNQGSFVDVGLPKLVRVDKRLEPNLRVTVRMISPVSCKKLKGLIVNPNTPSKEKGLYWGYNVRQAENFHDVFTKSPYPDGYDLTIGTSERGSSVDEVELSSFRHLLIVFGGLNGIEACLEEEETLLEKDAKDLFHYYLNTCPGQGSRTIRTEEAILVSLSILRPKIESVFQNSS